MKKEDYLKNQEIKYKLGVIDRRQFITSAIATGVAVPAALGLANQLQAATPKKGGKFRMGIAHGSTTDTLDSGTSENHFTLISHCFSSELHNTHVKKTMCSTALRHTCFALASVPKLKMVLYSLTIPLS